MNNLFIIGKGFVGSHVANFLKDDHDFIINFANRKDVNYFDEISLKKYVRTSFYNPSNDVIILNCSGYTGKPNVDACESNKEACLEYNTKLPVFLSNFCEKYNYYLINVSSGCIFTGYEKEFTEEDIPNFGMFNPNSSFYSKTKHLAEYLVNPSNTTTLRIRMPFCDYPSDRNYLNKILKYDNLVCYKNSMTSLDDLATFIRKFIKEGYYKSDAGIYNVVNEGGVDAREVVELFSKYNIINPNWKFVDIENLQLKANRSNCILSTEKIKNMELSLPNALTVMDKCVQALG